jgi:hypothetical protein
MAREYDPTDNRVVMKMSSERRGGMYIYNATCKEDGERCTGFSEAEAARAFGDHMARSHPGRTVRRQ